ncbi:MAG: hypothetical protein LBT46_09075 [Planctomycetaceae bacterium]|jgi:hypothetical protein|nr:hypothetical protein [Planctomycetaceae bacterium]
MLNKALFLTAAALLGFTVTAFAETKQVSVDGPAVKRAFAPVRAHFVRPLHCPVTVEPVVVEEPVYVPFSAFRRSLHGFVPVENAFVTEGEKPETFGRVVKGIAPCGNCVDFQRTAAYKQTLFGSYRPVKVWAVVE